MRIDRWKTFWVIAVLGLFGGSVGLVFTGDDAAIAASAAEQTEGSSFKENAKEPRASEPVIQKTDEGCLADSATLMDLRRQKIELETRIRELNSRDADLKAREQALNDQMKSLATTRDELEKIDQSRKAEGEAKVAKLVEAVENMNPKAAAQLLGTVDEGLATATMARLTTGKLAKVLNVMDPARSTKLSELLAGVARAKPRPASHDVAVATTERTPAAASPRTSGPSKGGDTNDGKSHEQASNRTTADGDSTKPSR